MAGPAGWEPILETRTLAMPALGDLLRGENILTFALRALIGDERPRPENVDERHFIRTVDKAITAYESSRSRLGAVVGRPADAGNQPAVFVEMFRAINDLETCFAALRRALAYARRIASFDGPPFTLAEAPVAAALAPVKKFRDGMEHADDWVRPWRNVGVRIGPDELVIFRLWSHGLEFAGETLSFELVPTGCGR